jgi:imidazolonepropionase-like amidohydrolase
MALPTNSAFSKNRFVFFSIVVLIQSFFLLNNSRAQEAAPQQSAPLQPSTVQPVTAQPSTAPQQPNPAQQVDADKSTVDKPTFALVNGYLMPMTGAEPIAKSRVLITGDKIVAVGGEELAIPDGVQQIDLKGLTVVPGLIDLQSRLWVADSSADFGASDGSLQVIDSLDPFSENWQEVIRQGVTTTYTQPSSRGAMSGLGAAISVVPNSDGSLKIHSNAAGLQMSMGDFRSNRERQQRYESLKKSIQSLVDYKKSFDEYEQYLKKKKEDEEKAKAAADKPKESADKSNSNAKPAESPTTKPSTEPPRGEAGGPPSGRPGGFRRGPPGSESRPTVPPTPPQTPSSTPAPAGAPGAATPAKAEAAPAAKPPKKPEPDKTKDRLLPVLTGKIPVRLALRNANDFRFAVQLMDEFKEIQWVLEGVDDLQSAESLVQKRRIPIVIGPWLNLASSTQSNSKERKAWSSLIAKNEGAIGIGTFNPSPRASGLLREHAAAAVASGMLPQTALESMTSTAARLLGLSDSIGSIAVGKRADIIAIAGDPTDTSAPVSFVMAGGVVQHQPSATASTLASENKPKEVVAATPAEPKTFEKSMPASYALRSSRVLLQEEMVPATLTISDGKIKSIETSAIASDASVPVIDVGSNVITPGLFSAYATLGLDDLTATGADSDSAAMTTADFSLRGSNQQRQLQETGVFSVAFATATSNTLSGQISLVSMDGSGSVLFPAAAVQIVVNDSSRRPDRFPSSLVGQVKLVKELLGGKINPSRLYIPTESLDRLSQSKQSIATQLVAGKQLAIFQVSTDAEVNAALSIIEQFKLKAALMGAREWTPFIDRLKALGVAIIAKPASDTDYQWYYEELVLCQSKGVPVYFGGDTALQLRATASQCVRQGMPSSTALRSLTQAASMLYGAPAPSSGLNAGSPANVVIWTDSPLNLAATVSTLIVDGKTLDRKSDRYGKDHKVKP